MKSTCKIESDFCTDDLHFVWEESVKLYSSRGKQKLTETEAKKITKAEAEKLLLITREE
jgi:hypothetical protein